MSKILHFIKVFGSIVFGVFIGLPIGLFLFLTVWGFFSKDFYKPYIILSGSMEPAVPVGSIVISKPMQSYSVGDIITFSQNGSSKDLVTHRVASISKDESGTTFKTKGDANEEDDGWTIKNENVVGKTSFIIPLAGYVVDFAKKPQGFILFVIIPATIVVYEELKNIKNEISHSLSTMKEKRRRKNEYTEKLPSLAPHQSAFLDSIVSPSFQKKASRPLMPSHYLAILVPLFGVAFVIAFSASHSFFSDQEKDIGNTIGAAASFSTASPSASPTLTALDATTTPTATPTDSPSSTPSPTESALPTVEPSPTISPTP